MDVESLHHRTGSDHMHDSAAHHVSWFSSFSRRLALWTGKPVVFAVALLLVVLWAVTGPLFGFSDTWQLVINTSTTIITFLMVFLIQNTQNRDTEAIQIKLDELIRVTRRARNTLLDLEELDERELEQFRKHFTDLAERSRSERADRAGKIPHGNEGH
jgi:low affinity Fe/Cu permease